MNSAAIAVVVLVLYFFGYRFSSKYISRRVLQVSDDELTPSHELNDLDFVPTNPDLIGSTLISVLVIRFAATSLDTASRIQRLIISELGAAYKIRIFESRYVGAAIAVLSSLLLAILAEAPGQGPGSGGFLLWPLFGATNQLVGGLTLLAVTISLWKTGRPVVYTLIPMIFLILMTTGSMILNFREFARNPLLLVLSAIILALAVRLMLEAAFVCNRQRNSEGIVTKVPEMD